MYLKIQNPPRSLNTLLAHFFQEKTSALTDERFKVMEPNTFPLLNLPNELLVKVLGFVLSSSPITCSGWKQYKERELVPKNGSITYKNGTRDAIPAVCPPSGVSLLSSLPDDLAFIEFVDTAFDEALFLSLLSHRMRDLLPQIIDLHLRGSAKDMQKYLNTIRTGAPHPDIPQPSGLYALYGHYYLRKLALEAHCMSRLRLCINHSADTQLKDNLREMGDLFKKSNFCLFIELRRNGQNSLGVALREMTMQLPQHYFNDFVNGVCGDEGISSAEACRAIVSVQS